MQGVLWCRGEAPRPGAALGATNRPRALNLPHSRAKGNPRPGAMSSDGAGLGVMGLGCCGKVRALYSYRKMKLLLSFYTRFPHRRKN